MLGGVQGRGVEKRGEKWVLTRVLKISKGVIEASLHPASSLHAHLMPRHKGIGRAPLCLALSGNREKVEEKREGNGNIRKEKKEGEEGNWVFEATHEDEISHVIFKLSFTLLLGWSFYPFFIKDPILPHFSPFSSLPSDPSFLPCLPYSFPFLPRLSDASPSQALSLGS